MLTVLGKSTYLPLVLPGAIAGKITLIIGHDWEFILTGSFCLLNTGISYQGVESTFREASIDNT